MRGASILFALLLNVCYSRQECAIESVASVPTYICNSLESLQDQRSLNFDITVINKQVNNNLDRHPNVDLTFVEDDSLNKAEVYQFLKDLTAIFKKDEDAGILPAGIFTKFPVLEIRMTHNGVTSIEKGSFAGMPSLRKLQITNNKLTVIKNETFSDLLLEELDLSENRIYFLEKGAFKNMPRLKILRLDSNQLTEFQPELLFDYPQSLEELILQHNELLELSRTTVLGFSNLKHLDVSKNKLSRLNSYTLTEIPKLETLNIGHNSLLELKPEVLPDADLKALKRLYLNNNKLSFLSSIAMEKLRFLEFIRIGGNPWQCPCLEIIHAWLTDHKIEQPCDFDYYEGGRPICIFHDDHPNGCTYEVSHILNERYTKINEHVLSEANCTL